VVVSGKPAIIRESDVTRILRGAAKAGITLGIVVRGDEVRFHQVDPAKERVEPFSLAEWRAKHDARKAGGRA
jgi:hypothetical protein